ncbi:MAG: restriction endonuclease subunit S, partial [Actinomycetota bacterium]|nr:restriction endonuclease subunit S [Actinomycetota bacterium]
MSWPTSLLREVARVERRAVAPEEIREGPIYVGLDNMQTGGGFVNANPVASGQLASTKFLFSEEHVLYGKLRPYLAKIDAPDFGGVCSTDILPIRPGPELDRRYLLHFLRHPAQVAIASSRSSGANLPRLSPSELEKFEIPLPPLPEQRRIAAILDHADALRAKRRESIARIDDLSRSIFMDLFGPSLESGEQVTLGDALQSIDSGRSPKCHSRPAAEGEYGVLKLSAVTTGEYLPGENKALPEDQVYDP